MVCALCAHCQKKVIHLQNYPITKFFPISTAKKQFPPNPFFWHNWMCTPTTALASRARHARAGESNPNFQSRAFQFPGFQSNESRLHVSEIYFRDRRCCVFTGQGLGG